MGMDTSGQGLKSLAFWFLAILVLGVMAYIRHAPSDPTQWHRRSISELPGTPAPLDEGTTDRREPQSKVVAHHRRHVAEPAS
jgi:hypothetical protein